MADQIPQPPETSQAILRRYLGIDAKDRLRIVEANLGIMVQAMLKEDPGEVGVKFNLPAVMLDLVREIRQIKEHLGLSSLEDSKPAKAEAVESSPVIRVEQIPLAEANL